MKSNTYHGPVIGPGEALSIWIENSLRLLRRDLSVMRRDFRTDSDAGTALTIAWALGWVFLFYTDFVGDSLWGRGIGPLFYTGFILLLYLIAPENSITESYVRILSLVSVLLLLLYAVLVIIL